MFSPIAQRLSANETTPRMKLHRQLLSVALLALALPGRTAATPPAPQLLPPDTLALLSIPDWSRLRQDGKTSPVQLLWDDPAMRPFRDKLVAKLDTEVLQKLERETGLKLAEYAELVQGQLSLAITRNGWNGTLDPLPGFVLVLDTRDQAALLQGQARGTAQEDHRRRREAEDRDHPGHRVHGGAPGPWRRETPRTRPARPPKLSLAFGQVGSVLVAGLNPRDLERVVGRLSGAGMPHLAEEAVFSADHEAFFRERPGLWLDPCLPARRPGRESGFAGSRGSGGRVRCPRSWSGRWDSRG